MAVLPPPSTRTVPETDSPFFVHRRKSSAPVTPERGRQVRAQVASGSDLPADQPVLKVAGLTKHFGGVVAADNLSLEVRPNEILSIIGPNGSGKTTLFNLISGLYEEDAGTITFLGQDITRKRPDEVAELGITRTFQTVRLFNNMTVLENLLVGYHSRLTANPLGELLQAPKVRHEERAAQGWAMEVLRIFGNRLAPRADHLAGSLSYANRRRLEIARALVSRPRLLLLDEPTAGMNPAETLELTDQIKSLRDLGLTIMLIEHKLNVVMGISDRVIVLDYGAKIAEGRPEQVRDDPEVLTAYLGRRGKVA